MDDNRGQSRIEGRSQILEVQSLLAEYEALQDEKLTSRRHAGILTEINIIAAAIAVGLVVATDVYPFALVLVMSVLCSCLGVLWITHNRRSLACSNYIVNTIVPSLRDLLGSETILGGEAYQRLPSSAYFPGAIKEMVGDKDRERPLGKARSPGFLDALRGLFGGRSQEESPDQSQSPRSAYSSGTLLEYLTFLLPSLGGLCVAIYGIFSSDPWHWYCTALLVTAIVVMGALSVNGWRWYSSVYAKGPPEEAGS